MVCPSSDSDVLPEAERTDRLLYVNINCRKDGHIYFSSLKRVLLRTTVCSRAVYEGLYLCSVCVFSFGIHCGRQYFDRKHSAPVSERAELHAFSADMLLHLYVSCTEDFHRCDAPPPPLEDLGGGREGPASVRAYQSCRNYTGFHRRYPFNAASAVFAI